jgi:hypothetical protein
LISRLEIYFQAQLENPRLVGCIDHTEGACAERRRTETESAIHVASPGRKKVGMVKAVETLGARLKLDRLVQRKEFADSSACANKRIEIDCMEKASNYRPQDVSNAIFVNQSKS